MLAQEGFAVWLGRGRGSPPRAAAGLSFLLIGFYGFRRAAARKMLDNRPPNALINKVLNHRRAILVAQNATPPQLVDSPMERLDAMHRGLSADGEGGTWSVRKRYSDYKTLSSQLSAVHKKKWNMTWLAQLDGVADWCGELTDPQGTSTAQARWHIEIPATSE